MSDWLAGVTDHMSREQSHDSNLKERLKNIIELTFCDILLLNSATKEINHW